MSSSSDWLTELPRVARGIRRRVLEHSLRHDGGYMSQACSTAELLATLYLRVLKLGPVDAPLPPPPFVGVPGSPAVGPRGPNGRAFHGPDGPAYDRFILSPSQYALVLYTALIELGRMREDGLDAFNRDGSTVEMIGAEHSPGHEMMSGSLGQGLSQAGGIAWARKRRGDTGRVWVLLSDGELQAGQTWEALQTFAHQRLDNLGIYVDCNGQQCDGAMRSVMSIEPIHERVAAFGARVFRVDGHDPHALAAPAELPPDGRPLVVIADTDPCRGLPLLAKRAPKLHYLRFASAEEKRAYALALEELR